MPDNDASSPADICDCSKAARREGTPGAAGRVRVLLPLPFPGALDYLAPEGAAALEPGSFVRAPLGTRSLIGVVWEGAAGGLVVAAGVTGAGAFSDFAIRVYLKRNNLDPDKDVTLRAIGGTALRAIAYGLCWRIVGGREAACVAS